MYGTQQFWAAVHGIDHADVVENRDDGFLTDFHVLFRLKNIAIAEKTKDTVQRVHGRRNFRISTDIAT